MAMIYDWPDNDEFAQAIRNYQNDYQQNNSQTQLKGLEIWLSKQSVISDPKCIDEMLSNIFMVYDCYYKQDSGHLIGQFFDKCQLKENDYEKLSCLCNALICPQIWFEPHEKFKSLFLSFEKAFCLSNNSTKTVSEHFSHHYLNDEKGFWSAVREFHSSCKFQDSHLYNLNSNVDLWLSRVPKAKEFVKPFCPLLNNEVNFSHIAYAYLNHGLKIEKDILHLHVQNPPESNEVFQKAVDFLMLNQVLDKNDSQLRKLKL